MSEVVKYHNQMNEVNFSGYTEKELNMFFSLVFLMKEQKSNVLYIPFSDLKELANGDTHSSRFLKTLDSVNKKLIKMAHEVQIGDEKHIFSLFNVFTTNSQTKTLTVKVNELFSYMLNDLIGNFTKFDLLEFINLKSSYSKNLFKLLKQWESTRIKEFELNEFRELLGVPNSYSSSDFNKRVLLPIQEELPSYFKNLKIEKIKTCTKVTSLKFTWSKQYKSNDEVIDITISHNLQDAFEKALKNRFIKDFLTEDKKHKLIASFDEKDLIRGLKYAKDNINYSFKTFSYLENSIKKGLEKPIVKTTIVKTNNIEEKNIILGEQLSIKTKVTREEYEECYQEYLKSNNKKNGKEIRASWEFSVKTKFEIIEENKDVENDKDQFPPNDFSNFEKEKTKIEYPPLEECSPQTQELAAKLKKKREEFEKLNSFSKEILLSIIKLKTEISSAGFFSKKMLENELVNFEQKSQEWHWLFSGLEYRTLSLDNLKYFNELTNYFEDKLGIIVSETVIEQCVNHIQESPVNIEGYNLSSDTLKNLISIKDLPEEKLLSKNGKKLVGGALTSRLKKLAKELGKTIQLENGELILV